MADLSIKIDMQMPEAGICFNTPAPVLAPGEIITVKPVENKIYRIVESLAVKFTAVVSGLCCRVIKHVRTLFAPDIKNSRPVCRMTKLIFAGGLRL